MAVKQGYLVFFIFSSLAAILFLLAAAARAVPKCKLLIWVCVS